MKPSELLRLVWINITQNKFKTIMTSIGIIVGAATIVMVIAIGKGGQEDVADQFKNLNAGAIDISYDGGDKNRGGNQSSDDSSDSGMMMMPSGSGAPSGSSSSGGSGASGGPSGGFTGGGDSSGGGPSGGPGGGNGGDGGGMPGDMGGFFGGGSDMEDRMNQENITLDEDDVDDIETFVSGISAATISYMTRSTVDGGDLDEAQTYSIAGVKDSYAAISNLSLAVGDFITESDDENKEKVCVLGASIAEEIFGSAIDAYGSVIYIDDRSYVVNGVLSSMGTVASGQSCHKDHGCHCHISGTAVIHLLFYQNTDTGSSDHSVKQERNSTDNRSRNGINQHCQFPNKGTNNRKNSCSSDHIYTVYLCHCNHSDIFPVSRCRYRTDKSGDHSGKVICKKRTVKSRFLQQVSADDLTRHDLMSDMLGSDHKKNRQHNDDCLPLEFRCRKIRNCQPGRRTHT